MRARRNDPAEHWKAIEEHGFKAMAPCDIMDEYGEMDLPVQNGFHLDKRHCGQTILPITIPFWFCPISKAMPWAVSAAR